MGSYLILIKHSQPEIIEELPANQWQLSQEGIRRCLPLAQKLEAFNPQILHCSRETKAEQTAQIIAEHLGLSVEISPGLHEHLRNEVLFLDQKGFEASVEQLFKNPTELVYGEERAVDATHRFDQAISRLLAMHPKKNLAVVAHGTVISLYTGQHCSIDPHSLWKRLGLPSFLVLSMPEAKILHICEAVE